MAKENQSGYDPNPVRGGSGSFVSHPSGFAIGVGARAEAEDAVAVGNNAVAGAEGSVAFGPSTEVAEAFVFAFGDRDLLLDPDSEIRLRDNSPSLTLANTHSTDEVDSGKTIGYSFDVGGETVLDVRADADGEGGVENARVVIPGDLTVDGEKQSGDTSISSVVDVQDSTETTQFLIDATSSPPSADFKSNPLESASDVETESLSGDLVDREEPITSLSGNRYVTEVDAEDPTENDGDIWIQVDTGE